MSKPSPDMNTRILLDIQEQLKNLQLAINSVKKDVKCEIRGCQRSIDMCHRAFKECAQGYNDIKKSYVQCAKGYEAVKETCEDIEDTIMTCSGGGVVVV